MGLNTILTKVASQGPNAVTHADTVDRGQDSPIQTD